MLNILPVSKAALLSSVIICCIVIINAIMLLSFLNRKPPVTNVCVSLDFDVDAGPGVIPPRCWAAQE